MNCTGRYLDHSVSFDPIPANLVVPERIAYIHGHVDCVWSIPHICAVEQNRVSWISEARHGHLKSTSGSKTQH